MRASLRLAPACQQHREGQGEGLGFGGGKAASTPQAEAFCADEASLQAGLGESFAAARPGVTPSRDCGKEQC